MSAPVPDRDRRLRALDPARSFIVQAPAGSGKTELLIQRFLVLLARVDRPEEIAAITFTRKAAAEMRRRIFDALRAARRGEPAAAGPAAATRELARAVLERNDALGWSLEESASRLRVQTIDALCVALTRQMPVLSRFGAQPESLDDASLLYAEAARNTLAAIEDPEDPAASDVERLLSHVDNDALHAEALVAGMLQRRDHWIRSLGGAGDREALEATLSALRIAAVRRARSHFPPGAAMALPAVDEVEAWRALADEWLTAKGEWRKRHPVAQSLAGEGALREALAALRMLPEARYSDSQWEALGAIARLLPRAVAELKLVFAARGQADFVEISQAALRALQGEDGPTDLMLALDYRIRHVLVDEFQDTSHAQHDLLRQLTSGWEPGDGRTLFVVGDPMQSIYRFREAEVALFLEAQRDGIGAVALEPITLAANFRSQGGIVDWVNGAFTAVMPSLPDPAAGAVPYSPSVAVHPGLPAAVEVHPFFDGDSRGEAVRVAALAREALGDAANPGGTVAILVRSRGHLEAIVPSLRAAGLAFRAIEIEPLGDRPVVQDLLALARALSHGADRTAWLAVLRAPWAGLSLADLEGVASAEGPLTVWEAMHSEPIVSRLSPPGQERVAATRAALAPFVRRRGREALRDLVEGAWIALGGPACAPGETELEDAEVFLERLQASEEAGTLADPGTFGAQMAALFAQPDAAASDRLQVMTIHKAKGLEFDTVIVPGLGADTAQDERQLFLWTRTTAGLLLAPVNPTGSEADATYDFIRRLERQRADHECGRLLYVAATRARRRLHLLGECRSDEDGPRPPAKGSLLAKLWPAVAARFAQAALASDPAPPPQPSPARQDGLLLRLATPIDVVPPADAAWRALGRKALVQDAIEFSWAGLTARHVGTVVHRWLQRMADDALKGWDARRVEALRPALASELLSLGVARSELEAAVARASAALASTLADPRGRWLLGPQRDARNEYRISAIVEGERRNLVIDRAFTDPEGRRWIVDYKTSSHEGADLERFLVEEQKRYAGQLERYAAAVGGDGARLGLYFPLLKGWREWGAGADEALALTE
jgi:ATP-dependent exoDNAse (exonuclease V) beta subunit